MPGDKGPEPDVGSTARLGQRIIDLELQRELEGLRGSDGYRTGDHSAVTLVKRDELSVVLVALKAGGRMHEHRADAPITVHVLEGQIHFTVDRETYHLLPQQLLAVAAGLPHAVTATEDSAFLLTIAGIHRNR